MTDPGELLEVLRSAFPRDDAGHAICCFCGGPRKPDHALCRTCWAALPARKRRAFAPGTTIESRARLLLAILDGNEEAAR